MIVTILKKNPDVYSCLSYYLKGEWNEIGNINTLIDVGMDDYVLDEINSIPSGIGNKLLSKIILTHEHYDHSAGVQKIKEITDAKVYAFNKNEYVDYKVSEGTEIEVAATKAKILHTPGHSEDSICIYFEKEKILFSGDTPLDIKTSGGTYSKNFPDVIKRIMHLNLNVIYSGHNQPLNNNIPGILKRSYGNVLKSTLV